MNKDWFKTLNRRQSDSVKYERARDISDCDDVIALSVADSNYETSPAIKNALHERIAHGAFGYLGVPKAFPNLIRTWFERRYRCAIEEDWVLSGATVINTLAMAMRTFTDPKDKILIQTPVYHVFNPLITHNDRTVVENELIRTETGYRIDFEDFRRRLESGVKIFILCNPHNPVGRVFTSEELEKLLSLCKQYDVIVVSDEVHADLIMPGVSFISAARYVDRYEKIIVVSGPGKTFNLAGMQSAYLVVADETMRKRLADAFRVLAIGYPSVLAYHALRAAYLESDEWVDAQNVHIYDNYETLRRAVHAWHADAWIAPLEGTYLTWIDIRFTNMSSSEVTKRLAEYGLVVSDGGAFGGNRNAYIRIALACSKAQLKQAIERIESCFSAIGVL